MKTLIKSIILAWQLPNLDESQKAKLIDTFSQISSLTEEPFLIKAGKIIDETVKAFGDGEEAAKKSSKAYLQLRGIQVGPDHYEVKARLTYLGNRHVVDVDPRIWKKRRTGVFVTQDVPKGMWPIFPDSPETQLLSFVGQPFVRDFEDSCTVFRDGNSSCDRGLNSDMSLVLKAICILVFGAFEESDIIRASILRSSSCFTVEVISPKDKNFVTKLTVFHLGRAESAVLLPWHAMMKHAVENPNSELSPPPDKPSPEKSTFPWPPPPPRWTPRSPPPKARDSTDPTTPSSPSSTPAPPPSSSPGCWPRFRHFWRTCWEISKKVRLHYFGRQSSRQSSPCQTIARRYGPSPSEDDSMKTPGPEHFVILIAFGIISKTLEIHAGYTPRRFRV